MLDFIASLNAEAFFSLFLFTIFITTCLVVWGATLYRYFIENRRRHNAWRSRHSSFKRK